MNSEEIRRLPKVELHRHLEGSLPLDSVLDWSRRHNLPLPAGTTDEEIKSNMQVTAPIPFKEVLDRFLYQQRCFQSAESVEALTYETLKSIAEDNIKIIELRFSPGFMAEPAGLSFNTIMEATLSAKAKAEKEFDMAIGYLLITSRDYGVDMCEETVDLAIRWKKEIIGIDLAGNEVDFPSELFEKPFQRAEKAGLHITTHSAEVTDAKEILTSIEKLKAKRIGHGIQVIHDPTIMETLKQHHIPLEISLTSNVMTQAVPNIQSHPLKKLIHYGVPVTLNSDDPTLFNTTLSEEYRVATETLGLTRDDIYTCLKTAARASFIPDDKKERIWKKHFFTFLGPLW
jgi:adenosine deaminase